MTNEVKRVGVMSALLDDDANRFADETERSIEAFEQELRDEEAEEEALIDAGVSRERAGWLAMFRSMKGARR
jgi:hypothetical protein